MKKWYRCRINENEGWRPERKVGGDLRLLNIVGDDKQQGAEYERGGGWANQELHKCI